MAINEFNFQFQTSTNVYLNKFVIQMLHVQIHLVRLSVNAIRDLLGMDLYVMVRSDIRRIVSRPLWLTFVIGNQKSYLFYQHFDNICTVSKILSHGRLLSL